MELDVPEGMTAEEYVAEQMAQDFSDKLDQHLDEITKEFTGVPKTK